MEHQISLDGKVALVTGAGRGLGFSMTTSLCKAGARVIAIDRDPKLLEKLAAPPGIKTFTETPVPSRSPAMADANASFAALEDP